MPVMNGYTAVKLIREKNNKIPIIAQTAPNFLSIADNHLPPLKCPSLYVPMSDF